MFHLEPTDHWPSNPRSFSLARKNLGLVWTPTGELMTSAVNCEATDPALAELAVHFGIEPGFQDTRGENVITTSDTKKRLLAAMRVEAATEREAALALNRARSAEDQSPLPNERDREQRRLSGPTPDQVTRSDEDTSWRPLRPTGT